jgi:hypothetical protein
VVKYAIKGGKMKKIYLLITIAMLCLSTTAWAGYSANQDMPQQNVIIVPQESPKHWYIEMSIGGGTLLLGAIGLWLKYRKK